AANYLVTLRALARSLVAAAGAPPDALDPLLRGVMENGFELTGPIARGDWETVERHLAAIRERRPELETLYLELARATAAVAGHVLPAELAGGRGGERDAFRLGDEVAERALALAPPSAPRRALAAPGARPGR
ncbi:MAG: DUF2520 domain-containing protein, partial [Thermoleophilia bacterium]|nr:DUF2520 domain-containing protein [Gaiellaceae bacterium]MDW8339407.1 DUF2520 domain-containing protein [Thermoleophilia bacterium]